MAINALIGDRSFARAFGRAPTASDPAVLRIQTHLAYAEAQLRDRGAPARVLDRLRAYWQAGRFPRGESCCEWQPTFIDDRGVRCAVAHLAEPDLGEAAIRALDADYHNAYVRSFDSPLLAAWAHENALTIDDLALIQPSYPPVHPDVDVTVAAEYRHAIDHDEAKGPAAQVDSASAGVRWNLPHNYYVGTPVLGVDGALGASAGQLVYDAHVRVGAEASWYPFHNGGHAQRTGAVAGFGLDAIGSRLARAWTVPIDAYWYVRSSQATRVGVVAGPRFAVAGADRGVGWRAGIDFAWRDVVDISHPLAPRDVHVGAAIESIGDVTFVGVSLSIVARGRYGFYGY